MCSSTAISFTKSMGSEWIALLSIATLIFASSAQATKQVRNQQPDDSDLLLRDPVPVDSDNSYPEYFPAPANQTGMDSDLVTKSQALLITIIVGLILILAYVSHLFLETHKALRPLKQKVTILNCKFWKVSSAFECLQEDFEALARTSDKREHYVKRLKKEVTDLKFLLEVQELDRKALKKTSDTYLAERDCLMKEVEYFIHQFDQFTTSLTQKDRQVDLGTEAVEVTPPVIFKDDKDTNSNPKSDKWFSTSEPERSDENSAKIHILDESIRELEEDACDKGDERVKSPAVIDGNGDHRQGVNASGSALLLSVPAKQLTPTSDTTRVDLKSAQSGGGDCLELVKELSDNDKVSSECPTDKPVGTPLLEKKKSLVRRLVSAVFSTKDKKKSKSAKAVGELKRESRPEVTGRAAFKPP